MSGHDLEKNGKKRAGDPESCKAKKWVGTKKHQTGEAFSVRETGLAKARKNLIHIKKGCRGDDGGRGGARPRKTLDNGDNDDTEGRGASSFELNGNEDLLETQQTGDRINPQWEGSEARGDREQGEHF